MDAARPARNYKNLLAVLCGTVAVFLMALLLYPLVQLVFDKFFHLFEETSRKDDMIVIITMFAWPFISSIAGGMICTLMSISNQWLNILLSMTVVFVILLVLSGIPDLKFVEWSDILIVLMIPFGYVIGKLLGDRINKKRNNKKGIIAISNTLSSPPDIAEQ